MKSSFKVLCMIKEDSLAIQYQIEFSTTTAECALSTVIYPQVAHGELSSMQEVLAAVPRGGNSVDEKPLAFHYDTAFGAPSTGLKLYDSNSPVKEVAYLLRLQLV